MIRKSGGRFSEKIMLRQRLGRKKRARSEWDLLDSTYGNRAIRAVPVAA
jgi:hypothetical protein